MLKLKNALLVLALAAGVNVNADTATTQTTETDTVVAQLTASMAAGLTLEEAVALAAQSNRSNKKVIVAAVGAVVVAGLAVGAYYGFKEGGFLRKAVTAEDVTKAEAAALEKLTKEEEAMTKAEGEAKAGEAKDKLVAANDLRRAVIALEKTEVKAKFAVAAEKAKQAKDKKDAAEAAKKAKETK